MNTCGNCKHWYGCNNVEENHAHYCYEEYNDEQDARTTADASCPRFTAKEPEIPAVLKNWTPEWHPESEKPEIDKPVFCYEVCPTIREVLRWDGTVWRILWNSDQYDPAPDFWTYTPRGQ